MFLEEMPEYPMVAMLPVNRYLDTAHKVAGSIPADPSQWCLVNVLTCEQLALNAYPEMGFYVRRADPTEFTETLPRVEANRGWSLLSMPTVSIFRAVASEPGWIDASKGFREPIMGSLPALEIHPKRFEYIDIKDASGDLWLVQIDFEMGRAQAFASYECAGGYGVPLASVDCTQQSGLRITIDKCRLKGFVNALGRYLAVESPLLEASARHPFGMDDEELVSTVRERFGINASDDAPAAWEVFCDEELCKDIVAELNRRCDYFSGCDDWSYARTLCSAIHERRVDYALAEKRYGKSQDLSER